MGQSQAGLPAEVRIIPVNGIGEVARGQDLARLIVEAAAAQGTPIESGDVVVVTQKVVSKAEGRLVALADVTPSPQAQELAARLDKDPRLVELVLRESRRIVRAERGGLITESRHGREGGICLPVARRPRRLGQGHPPQDKRPLRGRGSGHR